MRANRNRNRKVQTATPSQPMLKRGDLRRMTRVIPDTAIANTQLANGRSHITVECGVWTYTALPVVIISDVEIAGETRLFAGRHIVKTEHFSKYVSSIDLRINQQLMQTWDVDLLIQKNDYNDAGLYDGFVGIVFSNPNMYDDKRVADLFALGTGNLKQVKLELVQTSAFDSTTMRIESRPHAVNERKPALFTHRTVYSPWQVHSSGWHEYTDLPTGDDIQSILVNGEGITDAVLEVDGQIIFEGSLSDHFNYLLMNGKDPAAWGEKFYFDFHAEGEPTSLAALDLPAQVARGAKIKLKLKMSQPTTEVIFQTTHAGRLVDIR